MPVCRRPFRRAITPCLAMVLLVGSLAHADERFWAFQPPAEPLPVALEDSRRAATPLDTFVIARLEEKQLQPAPPANRRTLLRRVTFSLTGLPPTPAEVATFLADDAADAFAKVVDRLLASPRYGERWGRHWLDVARYADSNGLDENYAYANAWRYRDYVIASWNADKTYDQFVTEQLAGDLLPAADESLRYDRLIATGFLALGPKFLAEKDPRKMEMDIIDEQVDTVGRVLMGLTLGCARCHDHKFDPISTEDYYGLAGIFKSTRTMEHFIKFARWYENPLPRNGASDKSLTALGATEREVVDVPVHRGGSHRDLGVTVPRRFPRMLAGDQQQPFGPHRSGRLRLARWLFAADHPLTARVMVNRLWRWHFGAGLVRTTSNFGTLGEVPENQPLLDWLACRFMENGWSIKALHRRILSSQTYQMSGRYDAQAARIDPENRLRWRWSARRLEAEVIRDALLSVSGTIDLAMGGSLLQIENRKYVFHHSQPDNTRYDFSRRSVYLPVVRNNLYDVFSLFDYADASMINGDRPTTTVAPQALFLMNSDLVFEATEQMAENVLAERVSELEDRIQQLYLGVYGRPATDREVTRARSFLAQSVADLTAADGAPQTGRLGAWQLLCQILIAADEFIYLR
ncbi:MAG: DUF1549 and DUF1553 domain-containing protein [Planctomycetota bacterium]|nr:DUF1549 and DUF1553 domain-containing protein [Planctomycetota bacterium]